MHRVELEAIKEGDYIVVAKDSPLRGVSVSTLSKTMSVGHTCRAANDADTVNNIWSGGPGHLVFEVVSVIERSTEAVQSKIIRFSTNSLTVPKAKPSVPYEVRARFVGYGFGPSAALVCESEFKNAAGSLEDSYPGLFDKSFALNRNAGLVDYRHPEHGYDPDFAFEQVANIFGLSPCEENVPEFSSRFGDGPDVIVRAMSAMLPVQNDVTMPSKFFTAYRNRGLVAVRLDNREKLALARRAACEILERAEKGWASRIAAVRLFARICADDAKAKTNALRRIAKMRAKIRVPDRNADKMAADLDKVVKSVEKEGRHG